MAGYTPTTPADRAEMLATIGVNSVDELFAQSTGLDFVVHNDADVAGMVKFLIRFLHAFLSGIIPAVSVSAYIFRQYR